MHIAFALFADAANLSQEGKLNILGVFDTLHVAQLPAIHPRAALVVRIKGSTADIGTHVMGMAWVNPAGDELWSSEGELAVGTPPPGTTELDFPLIAGLDLPLDTPGTYTMRLAIDHEHAADLQLIVRGAAPAAAPRSGPQLMS
jgi:hypothetical protein